MERSFSSVSDECLVALTRKRLTHLDPRLFVPEIVVGSDGVRIVHRIETWEMLVIHEAHRLTVHVPESLWSMLREKNHVFFTVWRERVHELRCQGYSICPTDAEAMIDEEEQRIEAVLEGGMHCA